MKRSLLIFFVFTFSWCAGQLKFEPLVDPQGARIRNVTCLLKDKTGFLWIGTQTGLLRYDGSQFLEFNHVPNNSLSLPSSFVTCLTEDAAGNLWVGTMAGLCFRNPTSELFTTVFPVDHHGLVVYSVSTVMATSNGIWFGSYSGLCFFDFEKKNIQLFPLPASNPLTRMSRSMPQVKAISEIMYAANEKLWVATGSGLHQFDCQTNQWRYRLPQQATSSDSIALGLLQDIHRDGQGVLWGGSWGKGLLRFDDDGRLVEQYNFSHANLPEGTKNITRNCIDFIYQGKLGLLMSSYDAGLQFFDPEQKKFTNIPVKDEEVLPVEETLLDSQGILWVASPEGLYKADPYAQRFAWHGIVEKFFDNNFRNVGAFCEVDSLRVLVVVRSNGLYLFDRRANNIQRVATTVYDDLEHITAIHQLENGWFFLAGRKKSGWWHMPSDQFQPLPELTRALAAVPLSDSQLLLPAFNKVVEVNLLTRQSRTVIATQDSLNALAFYDAIKADDTTLLVASSKGLWSVDARGYRSFRIIWSDKTINSLVRHGTRIFMGTSEGLFEWRNERIVPVLMLGNVRFTLVGKTIAHHNELWLATNNGLVRFSVKDGTAVQFNNEDGLRNNAINAFSCIKLYDGQLLIGQAGGFFSIHPSRFLLNPRHPQPVITRFEVSGRISPCPQPEQELVLEYDENQLSLAFAGLNFAQPERNQFAHRLVGVGDEWNAGNTAIYAGMKGGDYILEIKAANNDGLWSSPVRFPIRIKKPYWQQSWFILLVALVILVGVYMLYRYQLNRRLEIFAMRNRIASDLHDEVGSAISSISLAAGMARSKKGDEAVEIVNQIEATSRETMDNMADIVWSIEPSNDTFLQVAQRMNQFGTMLLGTVGIEFHFEAHDALKANLNMMQRKNVYLIFKEAINNAAKYSRAKIVRVILTSTHRTFQMTIIDDGVGFDIYLPRSGNGLRNIHRRAAEIAAQLHVESKANQGTSFVLTVNAS